MEVDHTVEDGNDPREDLSLGPPKKRPHVQKLAHEDACNNSFSEFDVPSETSGGTSRDANRPPGLPSRVLGGAHLFVEACCGCALLSSCVAKLGFEVMPIDFEGNKHRPFLHVIQLDLRKPETWEFLRYVAESRRPFHFHFAPPCGTASRGLSYVGGGSWTATAAIRTVADGFSLVRWCMGCKGEKCKPNLHSGVFLL